MKPEKWMEPVRISLTKIIDDLHLELSKLVKEGKISKEVAEKAEKIAVDNLHASKEMCGTDFNAISKGFACELDDRANDMAFESIWLDPTSKIAGFIASGLILEISNSIVRLRDDMGL